MKYEQIQIQILIDDCVSKIGEHCDGVLIIATQSDGNKGHFSGDYSGGTGDFYSHIGMATLYLEKNKAIARDRAVKADPEY